MEANKVINNLKNKIKVLDEKDTELEEIKKKNSKNFLVVPI